MIQKRYFLIVILLLFSVFTILTQEVVLDETLILEDHEKRIDLIKTNLDYVWVIICTGMVFFMQAGFMSLESGMARSKNSINVAIKNLTDFVLGVVGFWIVGFGIMFGKSWNGLFGTTDFIISIDNPWSAAFFMFQAVFVGTAATIDSGAICGRAKLKQYILLSFILSVFIYPVFGHWAWGSFLHGVDPVQGGAGWLEARGFKDFAGSSVVHSLGGWFALAGVIIVGPRLGKFRRGKAQKIQPGDMRFVFLGTFILFFGWFGFNCGSTLSAVSDIATIALNTTIAACFGCIVSSVLSWITHPEKKIEGEMIANGVLAGLVSITAGCAYVTTVSSAIIGAVSGLVVFGGTILLEKVLKLDDVVGAIPVHGLCGAWGTLAVGLFITDDFLGDLNRYEQFQIQLIGVAVCFLWSFGMGLLFYYLVDKLFGGVRVTRKEELLGLNIAEHGATSSILELANTMDTLTKNGEFSEKTKVVVEQGTEIGDLAKLFNKMIIKVGEAIEESRQQQKVAELMLKESEVQKEKVIEAQFQLETQSKEENLRRKSFINETHNKVHTVTSRIEDVKDMMLNTSGISKEMNNSFTQLVGTLESMLTTLGGVYTEFDKVKGITASTTTTARDSKDTIVNLMEVTRDIEQMVTSINEIAARTQLLSINSSIEAARTGESGKGFTVIAKEIKQLSDESLATADKIGLKLDDIDGRILKVSNALEKILNIVDDINLLNSSIIDIIDESHDLSSSVREKSMHTIKAVESVSRDIQNVVTEADQLSIIGKQVEAELKTLE